MQSLNLNGPAALGSAVAPVLFSRFNAGCTNTATAISWTTQQEINSNRFELEKSDDGISWINFSSIPAAGNSALPRNYQQIDLGGGAARYRVKHVDKDGQFIYTDVARTNCPATNMTSLLYPVPAKDLLNVVIKSDRSASTQLLVYDLQGKLVIQLRAQILNGTNNFRINITKLAAGEYVLRSNDPVLNLNKVFTVTR